MSQTKVKSGLLNFPDQTDFVKLPSGTTAQRPNPAAEGYTRFNTTLDKLEYFDGVEWVDISSFENPIIESVDYPGDATAADPSGGESVIINGSNFAIGATVTVGGDVPSAVSYTSDTQITITTSAKTAGDYDIVITNTDGGTVTSTNGFSYNGIPTWTTTAGSLGSFYSEENIGTINLVATEPDAGAITYSVTSGALPTGVSLNSSTGDLTGTLPAISSTTVYNFTVTATDDEGQNTPRNFSIQSYSAPSNGLLAWYKFDDNFLDSAGNYDFVLSPGSSVNYIDSLFGKAIRTSRSSGDASLISLNLPLKNTISFWINLSSFDDDDQRVLDYNPKRQNQVDPRVSTTNGEVALGSGALLSFNTWHHVVVTINSTTLSLYYNGSLYNNYTVASGTQLPANSISTDDFETSRFYCDNIRVYSGGLNASEVAALYNEPNY